MRILIDIGHAAHVHLFRNFVQVLRSRGHEVFVVSRRKPYVLELLSYYGIENECLSRPGTGVIGLFFEWLKRTYKLIKLHRKYRFDLAIGTSVSIPYLTAIFGVRSINVQEDDDAVVPLHVILAYPFSSVIMNPKCLKYKFFRDKRYLHNSLHEMAYLTDSCFSKNESVVKSYCLDPYGYILIRRVALTAHHDIGAEGLTEAHVSTIRKLFPGVPIVTSEELKTSAVKLEDMHQILAHARLVVTDSQTMTAEAACLGVPVIRVSSFVGKLSYLNELENFEWVCSCLPADYDKFTILLNHFSYENNYARKVEENRLRVSQSYPDFNVELLNAAEEMT